MTWIQALSENASRIVTVVTVVSFAAYLAFLGERSGALNLVMLVAGWMLKNGHDMIRKK
jgi:hypothetical protein